MGIFNSSAILIARNHVGYVFSEDEAVVTLLADVVPLIAIFQIGDDITGATQGRSAVGDLPWNVQKT